MQTIEGIPVQLIRKRIKHLRITIRPPDGDVCISAPLHMEQELIRLAILRRTEWIMHTRQTMQQQQRQPKRQYCSGENHYYAGERYLLQLHFIPVGTPYRVELRGRKLLLHIYRSTPRQQRERLLKAWYRDRLQAKAEKLITLWSRRLRLPPPTYRIKHMRTRWGTCNPRRRSITLNLELAKKRHSGLEYIILHELCSLQETPGTQPFRDLIEKHMPHWESICHALNAEPLESPRP